MCFGIKKSSWVGKGNLVLNVLLAKRCWCTSCPYHCYTPTYRPIIFTPWTSGYSLVSLLPCVSCLIKLWSFITIFSSIQRSSKETEQPSTPEKPMGMQSSGFPPPALIRLVMPLITRGTPLNRVAFHAEPLISTSTEFWNISNNFPLIFHVNYSQLQHFEGL